MPNTSVPQLVGQARTDAPAILAAAGLLVGVTTAFFGPAQEGEITAQNPPSLTMVPLGTTVDLTVSRGPGEDVVPDCTGLGVVDATAAIVAAGFILGNVVQVVTDEQPLGLAFRQLPLAGSTGIPGTPVNLQVASQFDAFDVQQTIGSEYANSPVINQMIADYAENIDPRQNLSDFYNAVWNIDTAVDFGLDIWGRIVGLPNGRLLTIPGANPLFGFNDGADPSDVNPWSQGVWNTPNGSSTQSYVLNNDAFRILILTKALANISATTAPALNTLLRMLFPGRGRAYVLDLGDMQMQYTFEFQLTAVEFAILTQSGALPHPAGVKVHVVSIPPSGLFGFAEAFPTSSGFGQGQFYSG